VGSKVKVKKGSLPMGERGLKQHEGNK